MCAPRIAIPLYRGRHQYVNSWFLSSCVDRRKARNFAISPFRDDHAVTTLLMSPESRSMRVHLVYNFPTLPGKFLHGCKSFCVTISLSPYRTDGWVCLNDTPSNGWLDTPAMVLLWPLTRTFGHSLFALATHVATCATTCEITSYSEKNASGHLATHFRAQAHKSMCIFLQNRGRWTQYMTRRLTKICHPLYWVG